MSCNKRSYEMQKEYPDIKNSMVPSMEVENSAVSVMSTPSVIQPLNNEEIKPLDSNIESNECSVSASNASKDINNTDATFRHMCRVCMCKDENFRSIYDMTEKSLKISEMLIAVIPRVLICESDQLPKLICVSCLDKLISAFQFQEICMASDEYMRSVLVPKFISVSRAQTKSPISHESVCLEEASLQAEEFINVHESVKVEMNDEDVTTVPQETGMQKDPLLAGEMNRIHNTIKTEMNDEDLIDIDLVKPTDSQTPKSTMKISAHDDESNSTVVYSASNKSDSDDYQVACVKKKKAKTKKRKQKLKLSSKPCNRKKLDRTEQASNCDSTLPCLHCDKTFDTARSLRRHASVHAQTRKHDITLGATITESLSTPKSHKCPECPRRFRKSVSLSAHIEQHCKSESDPVFKCDLCPKKFSKYPNLAQHARTHKENQKFKCNVCEKTFARTSKLADHMKRHNGLRQFPCDCCDKAFYTKVALKSHQRLHTGEKPFLCPQCGKAFVGAGNLHQHMLRHSSEKRYQCPECPDRFTCLSDRSIHMAIHREVKRHVCDICGSSFTRAFTLAKHKMVHTGERPFKCEECNMTFVYIERMKRHMLTHTGEKRYKCKYCDRAYTASGDLNKHLRTHVGEKTYMCQQCPEAFKYQTELREHVRFHYKLQQQQQLEKEQQKSSEVELNVA